MGIIEMTFGLNSYSNTYTTQIDAGVPSLTWKRGAPANGSVGRSFKWSSGYGTYGLSHYGDFSGTGDLLGLEWSYGEMLAVNIPGVSISQVGVPRLVPGSTTYIDYYMQIYSKGGSNPNLSGHVYYPSSGTPSGYGLAVYNASGEPVFTSNGDSARVAGLIDIHPSSGGLVVEPGREYAAIFLNPSMACYRATSTRLDYYGIKRASSNLIAVELIYSRTVTPYEIWGLPLTSSYKALILDVTP